MKRSYNEIGTRMLFGILAGAVSGYIVAALPVLTEGHVLTKTVFSDMMGGVLSGSIAGAMLGGVFIYLSARKRKYYRDINDIRDIHKEIFYNARGGGVRALALRKEFPEDFWRIAIKAAGNLCAAYDERSGYDKTQRAAVTGLAAFLRAVQTHSVGIMTREHTDFKHIYLNMHRYISLQSMQALVFIAEDVELSAEEALALYISYFRESGLHLKDFGKKNWSGIIESAPHTVINAFKTLCHNPRKTITHAYHETKTAFITFVGKSEK